MNIFFYGDHLEGTTKEKDYVTDAISANRAIGNYLLLTIPLSSLGVCVCVYLLGEEHFESQHVYRVEWKAGPEGYISWYLISITHFIIVRGLICLWCLLLGIWMGNSSIESQRRR